MAVTVRMLKLALSLVAVGVLAAAAVIA